MKESLLLDLFYFFSASAFCVPIFKSLGLGSVIGYIVGGLLLGQHFFGLFQNSTNIKELSEIGIILLLFILGLELSTQRLSRLKDSIIKDGTSQFLITTAIVGAVLYMTSLSLVQSIVIATAITLSSTAFALVHLKESSQLTKSYGQTSISILLFQDLIIIPALTVIPLLGADFSMSENLTLTWAFKKFLMCTSIFLIAKYALLPTLSWTHKSQSVEIFVSTTMLFIFGASLFMQSIGLSKAIGAFLTGIFLSNSNFKTEIHKITVPLKSMLMGVFFMSLGLSLDLSYIKSNLVSITTLTSLFMGLKFTVLMGLGFYKYRNWSSSLRLGVILCQGGEFGLLILTSANIHNIIQSDISILASSCITLSLCLTPIIVRASEYFITDTSTDTASTSETKNVVELKDRKVSNNVIEQNNTHDKKAS